MMKINHEEYKALKELDDELKWIARDESGELYVYDEKPIKSETMWSYIGLHMEWIPEHEHLFHFIQWEDGEPHSIQKLIHDYEYKTGTFDWATAFQNILHGESKETEVKKDVKMMNDKLEVILDELDEFITRAISVETTSQTIEMLSGMTIEQVVEGFGDGKFDMKQGSSVEEELTMTKLETLVVPTDLGEWLQSREIGESGAYFSTIDGLFHYWDTAPDTKVFNFISQNKKELIEVILGNRGYEVEEELKYNVQLKPKSSSGTIGLFLFKLGDEVLVGDNLKAYYPEKDEFRLTELEIKDFDPRYWAFAEPVEEM